MLCIGFAKFSENKRGHGIHHLVDASYAEQK
jgi:hypothetical protein